MKKALSRTSALPYKLLFLLPVFIVGMVGAYNSDLWFLIATGREILDNGVPFWNPFALHDGMGMVVQQWLLATELYVVWDTFGMQGLAVQTGALCCVFYLLLSRAMRRFASGEAAWSTGVLAFLFAYTTVVFYFSVRPSVVTAVILLGELLVLERYKRGARPGILMVLPFCALLHVNVHASFWWLGPVLTSLYLVSPPRKARTWLPRHEYRKLPVLIAAFSMVLASLVNPYGLQGALYLAYSFGPAASMSIVELQPMQVLSPAGAIVLLLALLGAVLAIRRGRGRIDLQASILFAGTLILACANQRNGWMFIVATALFVSPFLSRLQLSFSRFGGGRAFDELSRRARAALPIAIFATCAACTALVVVLLSHGERWQVEDSPSTPIVAVNALNDEIPFERRDDVSIFNSFNNGGLLEWAGYPVFMDARPELWSSAVTGKEKDYAAEYARYLRGELSAEDLFDRYEFGYLLAEDGTGMDAWCREEGSFTVLAEGEGYRVWKRL